MYNTVPSSSFKFPENTSLMIRILWVVVAAHQTTATITFKSQVNSLLLSCDDMHSNLFVTHVNVFILMLFRQAKD